MDLLKYKDDYIPYTLDKDPDFDTNIGKSYQSFNQIEEQCIYFSFDDKNIYKNGYVRLSLRNGEINLLEIAKINLSCSNYITQARWRINLLANIILMDINGYKLEIIDTKQFLEHNEVNDNDRYQFVNIDRYYLDIPLFNEFYGFGDEIITFCAISYIKTIHSVLQNETIIKFEHVIKRNMKYENIASSFKMDIYYNTRFFNSNSNLLFINCRFASCPFIFYIIEKEFDIVPEIESITFTADTIEQRKKVIIDMDNVVRYEFDHIIVYGVATTGRNMNLWSNTSINNSEYFTSAFVESIYIRFADNENIKSTKINLLIFSII
jgi:hypothetical protein